MQILDFNDQLASLAAETNRLAELALSVDPGTPITTCPELTLDKLVAHVGRGHRWAAALIENGAAEFIDPRTVPEAAPPSDVDGSVEWLKASAQLVLDAIHAHGTETPTWTLVGTRPSAWWIRRRLHEANTHCIDVLLTLGRDVAFDARLANDALAEWLSLWEYPRAKITWPLLAGEDVLHLHATDVEPDVADWMIRPNGKLIEWAHEKGSSSIEVRGRIADLFLMMVRRVPVDDGRFMVIGDQLVLDGWLQRTPY